MRKRLLKCDYNYYEMLVIIRREDVSKSINKIFEPQTRRVTYQMAKLKGYKHQPKGEYKNC